MQTTDSVDFLAEQAVDEANQECAAFQAAFQAAIAYGCDRSLKSEFEEALARLAQAAERAVLQ